MLAKGLNFLIKVGTLVAIVFAALEYLQPQEPRVPREPIPVVIVSQVPSASEIVVTEEFLPPPDPQHRPPVMPPSKEETRQAVVQGKWWLPLAHKSMYIECGDPCGGKALVYEEQPGFREVVGIAEVDGDLVRIHLRVTKRSGDAEVIRNAYLTLHLSKDGQQLVGDFHGDDPRERGPVTWIRA